MKRILVYGMTGNQGGIESFLMNNLRVFAKEKDVIFDFVSESKPIAFEDEIKAYGGKIYYIASRRESLLRHMFAIRKILKANREYKTAYFNILSASEAFTVMAADSLKNVKIVVHSHNNYVKTIRRHLLLRPILNKIADKKLACSKEAAEFMFGSDRNVSIINNAIDTQKYRFNMPVREEIRNNLDVKKKFVVGHVGRLCYQKNSLFVLEIFERILKKCPEAVLVMVGEGEDRKVVENRIAELGLKKKVILTGMRKDVDRLLQGMDVFLLPSRFEGLPVTVMEAQAADLPTVVSMATPTVAQVIPAFVRLSIKENADEWAENVLRFKGYERKDVTETIKRAGYDSAYEANKLKELLFE